MLKRPSGSFLALLIQFLAAQTVFAEGELLSPFPSTVAGISIRNTHLVNDPTPSGVEILRGNAPNSSTQELTEHGVTDVLVFKNQTGTEIDDEIALLASLGLPPDHVTQIPFRWKYLPEFAVSCRQLISGLELLERAAHGAPGTRLFFHCTVGEDRTGVLAGLFRMIDQQWPLDHAFKDELCENGYENGNPYKPDYVIQLIRDGLTPLFLKMAYLVESGKLSAASLDPAICDADPSLDPLFQASRYAKPDFFRCEISSLFPGPP